MPKTSTAAKEARRTQILDAAVRNHQVQMAGIREIAGDHVARSAPHGQR